VKAADLIEKAVRSLKAAQLAFDDGDMDGAVSRAYYGMFYAAKAALLHAGHPEAAAAKTHAGLIAAVGQHLVKPGYLPAVQGRALNELCQLRIAADYSGGPISLDEAKAALLGAEDFAAIARSFTQRSPAAHACNRPFTLERYHSTILPRIPQARRIRFRHDRAGGAGAAHA
jgi:uncharacterized protein (UPF0332 family)